MSELKKFSIVLPEPKYDKRVREIHTHPCKNCPSAHFPPDPMSLDIKAGARSEQMDSVFRCGWRDTKACKGYCDFLDITPEELATYPYPDEDPPT